MSKVPVEEIASATIFSSPKDLDDFEIPFEEIASATDNFADKNLIYEGSSVNVYKGKLLGSGPLGNIVVQWRIERPEHQQQEDKGWKNIFSTCRLRRKPSVVGFCGDKDIIVYDHIGNNGSLKKDVSDPTFSWMQRLQTCIDIVKEVIGQASETLEFPPFFLRFNSGFQKVYMVCLADLMFEALCEEKSEKHLSILAIELYNKGKLEEFVHPHLRLQMHHKSFIVFSELAYRCIVRESTCLLSSVWKHLGRAWKIQNDFESYLDCSKIELKDIMLSTSDFAKEYVIGSETYNTVYKAELDHFDRQSGSATRDTVAIKCISEREDGQDDQGLFTELNMLVSCEHSNIVCFLGFCHEGSKRILVYNYGHSLDEYLRNTRNKIILTWAQRIKICLDIAHGLNYLHSEQNDKLRIVHGNIKSANILLGEKGNAMIADFGFSTYYRLNYKAITIKRRMMAGATEYLDPEYERTGMLDFKSDIYSFGVILFEILFGRLANDSLYLAENDKGLAPIAQRHFKEGTINEMVDPDIKKEADELDYNQYYGAIHDSLNTFSKIAYQCLAETPYERPTVRDIIKELQNASNFQEKFKIQLSTITESTNSFSQEHCIGSGTYGTVYKAELDYLERKSLLVRRDVVAIKHIRENKDEIGDQGFSKELSMLGCYHPNIISLLGFCDESSKKILVYEYALKESLAQHLESTDSKSILTWKQRLRICLGIANGLNYLHNNTRGKPRIIHRDIKSDNILLDNNWIAKIADFGLSKFHPSSQESNVIMTNNIAGTSVYLDPEYKRTGQLRRESDIYSFGVVLFEVLSGRLAYDEIYLEENGNGIAPIVRQHYNEGRLKDMVDPRMKEASDYGPNPYSLAIFSEIACRCLAKSHVGRPTIEEIIKELQSALNSQLEYTSTQASKDIHSIGRRVSSSTKGRCSSSGVKTDDQNVNHNEDNVISTQMEHSSDGGMGSHSAGERVSSFIRGRGSNNGDPHADCSEDTIVVGQERLDDTLANPKPGHDGAGLEVVLEPMTVLEKYSPEPSTLLPIDPQQWTQSVESQKPSNLFAFDATQDSKFALTGSPASCSTRKSYDGLALEVKELRDKIEKMEKYQKKLEAQLDAERAKIEKVELESKVQLEAERDKIEKVERELKSQLEAERAKIEKVERESKAQLEAEQAKIEKVERESKAQLEAEQARTAELEEMIVDMKARHAECENC